jgi:hypothetical protein
MLQGTITVHTFNKCVLAHTLDGKQLILEAILLILKFIRWKIFDMIKLALVIWLVVDIEYIVSKYV